MESKLPAWPGNRRSRTLLASREIKLLKGAENEAIVGEVERKRHGRHHLGECRHVEKSISSRRTSLLLKGRRTMIRTKTGLLGMWT